jgi:hypothetical protein
VRRAIDFHVWELTNDVLYRLCRRYPKHMNREEVLAKILLIGRSHAAAIERRRYTAGMENERFYSSTVARGLLRKDVDQWLEPLHDLKTPTDSNAKEILRVHGKFTRRFEEMTGMKKRSLASKYLHFHYPHLFFLYDSRAASEIRALTAAWRDKEVLGRGIDKEYGRFFMRCLGLQKRIRAQCNTYMSPRQLDNLLVFQKR